MLTEKFGIATCHLDIFQPRANTCCTNKRKVEKKMNCWINKKTEMMILLRSIDQRDLFSRFATYVGASKINPGGEIFHERKPR